MPCPSPPTRFIPVDLLQSPAGIRLTVAHHPLRRNFRFNDDMHVITPHMRRQQTPATMTANPRDRFQHDCTTVTVQLISLLIHTPPFRRGKLWIRLQQWASNQIMATVDRTRFLAMKPHAVAGKCDEVPHSLTRIDRYCRTFPAIIHRRRPTLNRRRALAIFFCLATVSLLSSCGQKKADFTPLKGFWLRPDGNYVLDLRQIEPDGKVTAAYYNPRPIHVAEATLSEKNGALTIFVKLEDTGYPGSTYDLTFDPGSDQLKGTYYHAGLKQAFEVFFVRMKR
jgi:hypothetical protein